MLRISFAWHFVSSALLREKFSMLVPYRAMCVLCCVGVYYCTLCCVLHVNGKRFITSVYLWSKGDVAKQEPHVNVNV